MTVFVKSNDGQRCMCGWPDRPCLRRVLRNGPPFPPEPCEPAITLTEHYRREQSAATEEGEQR